MGLEVSADDVCTNCLPLSCEIDQELDQSRASNVQSVSSITMSSLQPRIYLNHIASKRPTLFKAGIYSLRFTLFLARIHGKSVTRRGESGALYTFLTQLEKSTGNYSQSTLWIVQTGQQEGKQERELIAKGPSKDDKKARRWPAFQHEVKMQRLYKDDKMIRPMVDFLPSSETEEPMMILKPFEHTLWEARNMRPMTTAEIKWIMEGVLLGLQTIHRKGLVHTGLLLSFTMNLPRPYS